jgi:hypothetical protein
MTTEEYPAGPVVGDLTEPTDVEWKRFMDVLTVHRQPMGMAFAAAQTLTRVSDRAALYTKNGGEVPELLRQEIDAALSRWKRYRWTPRSNWRYP